jgi:membrane protein DedA with SNARE-associated domain
MLSNFFGQMSTKIMEIIDAIGYLGVIIVSTFEYACFPAMPSEAILPFIGFVATKGTISFPGAIIACTFAGILGSLICYFIGYFGGKPILDKIADKFPGSRKSIFSAKEVFDKYDKLSVMIARILPVARTWISVPAGIARMNLFVFIAYSSVGILVWNTILISLGYFLGNNWSEVEHIMKRYTISVGLLILAIVALFIFKNKKRRNKITS